MTETTHITISVIVHSDIGSNKSCKSVHTKTNDTISKELYIKNNWQRKDFALIVHLNYYFTDMVKSTQ